MLGLTVSFSVAFSSIMSVIGDKPKNRTLHYVFKPLTMVILIVGALSTGIADSSFSYWIIAGLVLSLLGDIFLMLPSDKFIQGLGSFLLAHIAYIVAFYQLYDGAITLWWLGAIALFSVGYFTLLSPNLGDLKLPVVVYILAISAMMWLSGELYFQQSSDAHLLLMSGALTFALSDASLAWNRFKKPFSWAQWLILLTYFAAQYQLVQAMLAM